MRTGCVSPTSHRSKSRSRRPICSWSGLASSASPLAPLTAKMHLHRDLQALCLLVPRWCVTAAGFAPTRASRKSRSLAWCSIRVAAETSALIKADSFKIAVRIYDPIDPRGKLGRISIPILANRAYSPGGLQPMEEAIGVLGLRDPSRPPWS